MSLILRYSTTLRGNMVFTGNSLGLSQQTNAFEPGTEGNLGAFISLDLTNKVNTFPNGTTLDYLKNGSSAILNLPTGSTVIHAELIWGGLYAFDYIFAGNPLEPPASKSVFNLINNPILLNGISVTPTVVTAQEHSINNPGLGSFSWYIRSADVTTIIQNNGGSGTYSVQQVPGLTEKISNYTSRTNHLGWTLAVVYQNILEEYTNTYLYVGANNITAANNTDLPLSGFETLPSGTVNSKVFLSAQEGDGNITGDQVSFGPTFSNLTNLSGPNNPSNNFFGGQINNTNGTLDTSGTFGSRNNLPSSGTNTSGSRHGWDITTVNVSSLMTNSQTSAALRIFTQGDAYLMNAIGLTTNSVYLNVPIIKSVDKSVENVGNQLTYSFNITNNSNVTITSNLLTDILQSDITFVPGTVVVNSTSLPLATPSAGIPIPDLLLGASATVSFKVLINNMPTPNIIYNTATLSFEYGGTSSPKVTSNQVQTIVLKPFVCNFHTYRVAVTAGNVNSSLFEVDLVTGSSTLIKSNLGAEINAIGFNPIDNLIYGMKMGTSNLYVIDSLGNSVDYGSIPNLPNINFETGAIDEKGHLFIRNNSSDIYYVIDINPTSINFKKLLDPTLSFSLEQPPYGTQMTKQLTFGDWAFNSNDGYLYAITSDTNKLARINPLNGFTSLITISNVSSGGYGSLYALLDNYIYAINDLTGNIYRINTLSNPTISQLFSQNFPNSKSDGANCPFSVLNTILDFGDAPDTSSANSTNNYSTLLINNGPRHSIVNPLFLGSNVTFEVDALQNSNATGDVDDCLSLPLSPLEYGSNSYTLDLSYVNNTGKVAYIYAWLDSNLNGIFELSEATVTSISFSSNTTLQNIKIALPVTSYCMCADYTFLRIRITTDILINSNGLFSQEDTRSLGFASDGEVEDYKVDIICFSASGIVFEDLNKNGLFDNSSDTLLTGITIAIFSNSNPSIPLNFTTTDINGSYSFDNLPKGDYFIKIYYPNNYFSTLYNVGNDPTIKSNILDNSDTSLIFSLNKTNIHQIINAGICMQNLFNISGFIFYDCNNDGTLNVNEPLLNNTIIDLYENSNLISTTFSGSLLNGYYEFTNLKPGNYNLVIGSVNGLNLTSLNTSYYGSKFSPTTNSASISLINKSFDNINAGFKGSINDTLNYCSCKSTIPSCSFKCNFC
ncbi:MAG: SdrD B-like domain-containing protein [Sarcina sp.]